MRKKRYFTVTFSANANNVQFIGSLDIISNNGLYLNRIDTIENIKLSAIEHDLATVVILKITELSETDFKNWTK